MFALHKGDIHISPTEYEQLDYLQITELMDLIEEQIAKETKNIENMKTE